MSIDIRPYSIDRLSFDRLALRLQGLLRSRFERVGHLGEFLQCTAHQPDILASFLEMTKGLNEALPDRLREIAGLTAACLMGNDYERHQHEHMSTKLGFGEAWIAEVERLRPEEAGELSEPERVVQRLIIAAMEDRGKGADAEFDAAVGSLGAEHTIAILFLIGRYFTHGIIVNMLGLRPQIPSIFAEAAQP